MKISQSQGTNDLSQPIRNKNLKIKVETLTEISDNREMTLEIGSLTTVPTKVAGLHLIEVTRTTNIGLKMKKQEKGQETNQEKEFRGMSGIQVIQKEVNLRMADKEIGIEMTPKIESRIKIVIGTSHRRNRPNMKSRVNAEGTILLPKENLGANPAMIHEIEANKEIGLENPNETESQSIDQEATAQVLTATSRPRKR